MKDLLLYMKILKSGSENAPYPIYAPYLYSDGTTLRSCNNTTYISLKPAKPIPFKGYVNIFILEEVLNLVGEDMTVEVVPPNDDGPEILRIKSGTYKADLNLLQNLGMPELAEPNFDKSIKLDEETVAIWKYALKYVGRESLSPLYIDKTGLCASDGYRIFVNEMPYDLEGKLSLNSKIMNFLKDQYLIMSDEKGNVNVQFLNGFAVFTTESLDFFPSERIRDFLSVSKTNTNLLCNISLLRDSVDKISPIFHGESEHFCVFSNANKKLTITGSSKINGVATVEVDSQFDGEFKLTLNAKTLKIIPFDYDCLVSLERQDRLLFKNELGSTVILMGSR